MPRSNNYLGYLTTVYLGTPGLAKKWYRSTVSGAKSRALVVSQTCETVHTVSHLASTVSSRVGQWKTRWFRGKGVATRKFDSREFCLAFESLNMFAVPTYSPNRLQRASCICHIAVLRTDEAPCWVCFVYMKKKLLVLVPIELTVMIPTILYGWIICSAVS